MLIGVVSDTHKDNNILKRVLDAVKDTDLLIHLGDNVEDVEELKTMYKNKIINVRGNCDLYVDEPLERIEELQGVKVLITHGHRYNVKSNLLNLKYRAEEIKADLVLFGHTHISEMIFEEGVWFVNPGSASLPRNGENTIVIIDIKNGEIRPVLKNI